MKRKSLTLAATLMSAFMATPDAARVAVAGRAPEREPDPERPMRSVRELAADYHEIVADIETADKEALEGYRGALAEMGVEVPGWGKMSMKARRAWLIEHMPRPAQKTTRKQATMPKDKNWRGRVFKAWKIPLIAARRAAADPEPMTRQVRRHKERQAGKMPIRMSQKDWHAAQRFNSRYAG